MSLSEDFCKLEKKVTEQMEVKTDALNNIIAFKITSEADFNLMIAYLSIAHSSCCDPFPCKIRGKYRGADWYFCNERRSGSRFDRFYVETLCEKKARFNEFLREYQ